MLFAILTGASAGLSFGVVLILCIGLVGKKRDEEKFRIYYMTRRDYFAANAMNALLSRGDVPRNEAVKEAFTRATEALDR